MRHLGPVIYDRYRSAWRNVSSYCRSWFASFPPFSCNDWLIFLRDGSFISLLEDFISDRLSHIAYTRGWNVNPSVMSLLFLVTSQYSFIEHGFDPYVFVYGGSSSSRLPLPAHSFVHPSSVTVPTDYMGHAFGLPLLPAITLCASLAYFPPLDAFPPALPPYHAPSREQSERQMVEDIELYNRSFHTLTVPRGRRTRLPRQPEHMSRLGLAVGRSWRPFHVGLCSGIHAWEAYGQVERD
jgi:hypothetical protein